MKLAQILVLVAFAMFFVAKSSAESLKVGDTAPAVTGVTHEGKTLNLGEVYKNGFTVVYFYPKADTPGCTAQGCSLRDAFEELGGKGVTVIGVSADSVEAQAEFRAKYNLPFTLLADTEKTVINAFGVPTRDIPLMGTMAARQAFLINKDGKIVWADHKASTDKQAQDILNALAKLGQR